MGSSVENWHEWICHTNFSFMVGASHPKELVTRAIEFGYQGLGIADYDGVYGLARSYSDLKELQSEKQGISLTLYNGAEVHLDEDHELPIYYQNTLILYALTHAGYFNLCQLLTYSHRGGKNGANLPLDYLLSAPVDDLIAIQPMRGLIRRKEGTDLKRLNTHFGRIKDHFGGRFYFAVSRHLNQVEDKWIIPTLELANGLSSPVLFCQDAFFATRKSKDISDLFHAIRHNKPLDEVTEHLFVNSRRCLHSPAVLHKIYGEIPGFKKGLANSRELATMFDFDLSELKYHYPKEMLPPGYTAQEYLELLTWKNAQAMFGQPLPTKISKLLKHELSLVQTLQFADYFLTVWDIVAWARSKDILCQGRGSAANSAICYVLGITAVNPDKFDLLFERFISVERGDPPDIDVDFENRRREEVIRYIYDRYGRENAAMVCNVVTFKSRGAVRFTGKALGVPPEIIDRVAKSLGMITARTKADGEVIQQVKREIESGPDNLQMEDHTWNLWAGLSERILLFPRFLSIHSGGFMLSDKEINWMVPQEPATMEGRTVIQWSKDDIEALGFFKIDILALGMLTALRKCFHLIKQHYHKELTLSTIPPDDQKTYQMIQRADTAGVFQIESTAQRASLPVLKPLNFYDLVVQVAIIRPGPILAGVKHPYLRRRNGLEPVVYADPRLVPILKRTYGTIIFQEQLMRVAIAIGNFTAGEANEIRKNIGSFSAKGNIGKWVVKLTEGLIENGISQDFIQEILKQIQGFSSYGFPESHAASFALLAYISSYLKCHYPAAFFASVLNSQPMGFYQPDTLIKTARHDGVVVKPVCVNHSCWESTLEAVQSGQFAIRLGLNRVKDLSENAAKAFVAQREKDGRWENLDGLLKNNCLSRKDLSALAAANAFHCFGVSRKSVLWQVEASPVQFIEKEDNIQIAFIPEMPEPEEPVVFPLETEMESIEADYLSTGTSLGRHFAGLIKEQAWVYHIPVDSIVASNQIAETRPDQFIAVFGMVLVRQSPGTARKMLFVTLEDEFGVIQIIIRPNIYAMYSHIIEKQNFLCVLGRLQKNDGAYSVLVSQVFYPIVKKADIIPMQNRAKYQRLNEGEYTKIRNYL